MNHNRKHVRGIFEHVRLVTALRILASAIVLALFIYAIAPQAFVSSEVRFTDGSRQGLGIVPASGESCNSSPSANRDTACPGDMCFNLEGVQGGPPDGYYGYETTGVYRLCCPNGYTNDTFNCYPPGNPPGPGTGTGTGTGTGSGTGTGTGTGTGQPPQPQCTPSYYCSGNNLRHVNSSCADTFVQACAYQCAGGACITAPSPNFVPFVATIPPARGGGTFNATGHLQARPTLVRAGENTQLYWNVGNVSRCTVTGTNGDSFSGSFSGASGRTTGAINTRTTFTLNCTALPTATPSTITESVIVNVAPKFQEQ